MQMFMNKQTPRITVTQAAKELIAELKTLHGDLFFHQSGGCCDGSSPMCFAKGDFIIGYSDIGLGEIEGTDDGGNKGGHG